MSFNRNYKVLIEVDGEEIEILPPMRIVFSCSKSNFGQMNTCTVKIYNLAKTKRAKLMFEPENRKYVRFSLFAGYGDSLLGVFRGSTKRASSERAGADYVTTIESIDGGSDYNGAYTSKVVRGDVVSALIDDMPNTGKGRNVASPTLTRPVVLVGNSSRLIEERLAENQSMYIDNEVLHIIDDKSYIKGKAHIVSAETGLISAPQISNAQIEFDTMMNPLLKIGHQIDLISTVNPSANGFYRIDTIVYDGDSHGSTWQQNCIGRHSGAMRAL